MATSRSVLTGLCLALAMITASACEQINEAMNSRDDLECTEVPEDICVRLADDIARQWYPQGDVLLGPTVEVSVQPVACGLVVWFQHIDPPPVRCWEATGSSPVPAGASFPVHSTSWDYYQIDDGRIFDQDGLAVED